MKRTFQPKTRQRAKVHGFPRPHEDQGRPPRAQGPPWWSGARPQDAQRLSAVTRAGKARPIAESAFSPAGFAWGAAAITGMSTARARVLPRASLVLVYLRGKDLKIGFSVSSKVGNAVTRNRVRPLFAGRRAHVAPAPEKRQVYLCGPRGRRPLRP